MPAMPQAPPRAGPIKPRDFLIGIMRQLNGDARAREAQRVGAPPRS
jgi:hypothetical protein